jgi:hypothetical protein
MVGKITVDRETFGDVLAEGFHTAFRKGAYSTEAHDIWTAIRNLPEGEWDKAMDYVMFGLEFGGDNAVIQWGEENG